MATEKLSEQEIQLRKRARRRLVGAIALVLLMVTVLPMVLDDREAPLPQPEVAISIPSQEGEEFSSRIVPVAPQSEPATTVAEMPESVSEEAKAIAPEKASVKDSAPPPVSSKPEKSEPAMAEKPDAAESVKMEAGAGHSVQIGVYSDAGNVKRLQEKLSSMGFKSYTENLDTQKGSKIRLRVGPFSDRAEAEKALDALKTAGMSGIVVSK